MTRLLLSRRQTITPIGDRLDIYVISQLEEKKKWN